jgi:hypothetical protein
MLQKGAIVMDNDLTMTASRNTVFGANSAGIEIRGLAQGNVVLNNRIRGRAGSGLAIILQGSSAPANNTFASNDLDGFHSTLAQVLVGVGVSKTLLVGRKATVRDRGVGTVIVNCGTTTSPGRSCGQRMRAQTGPAFPVEQPLHSTASPLPMPTPGWPSEARAPSSGPPALAQFGRYS